uniref:uncharacterized protein LOC117602845 n=1 Tax=Osmia lignaria TaxID=473952 RepID=UPI00147945C0|nr:uncharacterized protein LOC117602845 [Osmia lignaria]
MRPYNFLAELTFGDMATANEILKRAEKDNATFDASLPERKKSRKGVITDWEESIGELEEALVPGQPECTFERLKKKVIKDGKSEWVEEILATFKGDQLPRELWIGQGHVSVRVFPFIEAVKQCYRCFAFGHIQAQCRNRNRRCIRCLENEHGTCDRPVKCLNCGGNHTSLAKVCWKFQREKAVKKVMAYRNVAYATARDMVSNQLGERGIFEDDGDWRDGSRDFPALTMRNKMKSSEYWEKFEVSLENELQAIKESRAPVAPQVEAIRGWETIAENMRKDQTEPPRGRGRGRLNLVVEGDPVKTRERLVRRKLIELEKEKWENRYATLQPDSDPEDDEAEYTFGHGELEKAAIKKISRKMEQRANRALIEQLKKQREEEFFVDLLNLIADRGFENEVEKILRKRKYGKPPTEEEEVEYWNTRHRPDWSVPTPAKTQAKIDRKKALNAAKEQERLRLQKEWEDSLPGPSYARREREREEAEATREEERSRQRMEAIKNGPFGHIFGQNRVEQPDKALKWPMGTGYGGYWFGVVFWFGVWWGVVMSAGLGYVKQNLVVCDHGRIFVLGMMNGLWNGCKKFCVFGILLCIRYWNNVFLYRFLLEGERHVRSEVRVRKEKSSITAEIVIRNFIVFCDVLFFSKLYNKSYIIL